jgi:hypothetical protein
MGAVRLRMNIFFDALVPKRGGNGEPQISKHEERSYGGLRRAQWLLVAGQEPPLGSHVVTPRCDYQHRGIYVGDGKVVHYAYAGLAHGPLRRKVEDISLARFTGGHPGWVRSIRCDTEHRSSGGDSPERAPEHCADPAGYHGAC